MLVKKAVWFTGCRLYADRWIAFLEGCLWNVSIFSPSKAALYGRGCSDMLKCCTKRCKRDNNMLNIRELGPLDVESAQIAE